MIDKDKIYVVGEYVLVERDETPKAKNGIIIPGQDKVVSNRGYVLDAALREESAVCYGDYIQWAHYAGVQIDSEQPRLIVIKEDDIIAKLPDPNDDQFSESDSLEPTEESQIIT